MKIMDGKGIEFKTSNNLEFLQKTNKKDVDGPDDFPPSTSISIAKGIPIPPIKILSIRDLIDRKLSALVNSNKSSPIMFWNIVKKMDINSFGKLAIDPHKFEDPNKIINEALKFLEKNFYQGPHKRYCISLTEASECLNWPLFKKNNQPTSSARPYGLIKALNVPINELLQRCTLCVDEIARYLRIAPNLIFDCLKIPANEFTQNWNMSISDFAKLMPVSLYEITKHWNTFFPNIKKPDDQFDETIEILHLLKVSADELVSRLNLPTTGSQFDLSAIESLMDVVPDVMEKMDRVLHIQGNPFVVFSKIPVKVALKHFRMSLDEFEKRSHEDAYALLSKLKDRDDKPKLKFEHNDLKKRTFYISILELAKYLEISTSDVVRLLGDEIIKESHVNKGFLDKPPCKIFEFLEVPACKVIKRMLELFPNEVPIEFITAILCLYDGDYIESACGVYGIGDHDENIAKFFGRVREAFKNKTPLSEAIFLFLSEYKDYLYYCRGATFNPGILQSGSGMLREPIQLKTFLGLNGDMDNPMLKFDEIVSNLVGSINPMSDVNRQKHEILRKLSPFRVKSETIEKIEHRDYLGDSFYNLCNLRFLIESKVLNSVEDSFSLQCIDKIPLLLLTKSQHKLLYGYNGPLRTYERISAAIKDGIYVENKPGEPLALTAEFPEKMDSCQNLSKLSPMGKIKCALDLLMGINALNDFDFTFRYINLDQAKIDIRDKTQVNAYLPNPMILQLYNIEAGGKYTDKYWPLFITTYDFLSNEPPSIIFSRRKIWSSEERSELHLLHNNSVLGIAYITIVLFGPQALKHLFNFGDTVNRKKYLINVAEKHVAKEIDTVVLTYGQKQGFIDEQTTLIRGIMKELLLSSPRSTLDQTTRYFYEKFNHMVGEKNLSLIKED